MIENLVFLKDVIVCIADEGVLLGASIAGTENVSQTDILEALVLKKMTRIYFGGGKSVENLQILRTCLISS